MITNTLGSASCDCFSPTTLKLFRLGFQNRLYFLRGRVAAHAFSRQKWQPKRDHCRSNDNKWINFADGDEFRLCVLLYNQMCIAGSLSVAVGRLDDEMEDGPESVRLWVGWVASVRQLSCGGDETTDRTKNESSSKPIPTVASSFASFVFSAITLGLTRGKPPRGQAGRSICTYI